MRDSPLFLWVQTALSALVGLAIVAALAAPFSARAAIGVEYLVPACRDKVVCEKKDGTYETVPNLCTACDLFQLTQNVLNFIWYNLVIPLAVILLIVGGFLMIVPGASGEQSSTRFTKGKKIITTAVGGLLIVFFAWLGVDTIIKAVSGSEEGLSAEFGPWHTLTCTQANPTSSVPKCPEYKDIANATFDAGGLTYTNTEAAGLLQNANITISSTGSCDDPTDRTCTSLEGIHRRTISTLIALKNECARTRATTCPVTVTGGTEVGHSTIGGLRHDTGNKIDIAPTAEISAYFKSGFTKSAVPREDGADLYLDSEGWYAGSLGLALEFEKNDQGQFIDTEGNPTTDRNKFVPDHWDITVL